MTNHSTNAIILAAKKGYSVINEKVFYKGKNVSLTINTKGYYSFAIKDSRRKVKYIMLHRFTAYFLFGELIFDKNLVVRHLDGNKLNNSISNLAIGTQSDNMNDIPKEIRIKNAIYATSFMRKHDHELIIKDRLSGMKYSDIMKKHNITSKGTLSFIINKSMYLK